MSQQVGGVVDEVAVGVVLVPGIDVERFDNVNEAEVAVVMLARVDGAGRETDGTPAVVEHRTGGSFRDQLRDRPVRTRYRLGGQRQPGGRTCPSSRTPGRPGVRTEVLRREGAHRSGRETQSCHRADRRLAPDERPPSRSARSGTGVPGARSRNAANSTVDCRRVTFRDGGGVRNGKDHR